MWTQFRHKFDAKYRQAMEDLKGVAMDRCIPTLIIKGVAPPSAGRGGWHFTAVLLVLVGASMVLAGRPALAGSPAFYQMPDVLVNLRSEGGRSVFLKLVPVVELERQTDISTIETMLPRVMDAFQSHLRGLSAADVEGRVGLERLRKDLLTQVRAVAAPVVVSNLLIQEMLVQ